MIKTFCRRIRLMGLTISEGVSMAITASSIVKHSNRKAGLALGQWERAYISIHNPEAEGDSGKGMDFWNLQAYPEISLLNNIIPSQRVLPSRGQDSSIWTFEGPSHSNCHILRLHRHLMLSAILFGKVSVKLSLLFCSKVTTCSREY